MTTSINSSNITITKPYVEQTNNKGNKTRDKQEQNNLNQKGLLDKFETGIRNSADLNDTIKVPRTIFKGYLAFMISTTMATLGSFINPKHKKIKNGINISAALLALWGTYSFVRPYLIKNIETNNTKPCKNC